MTYAYDDSYDDAEYSAQSGDSAQALAEVHVIENYAEAPASSVATLPGSADVELRTHPEDDELERPRPKRTGGAPGRRRLGGLDGLRAFAVLAVVLFHLDFSLLPGGFLGVDVFFVISGFLITNLIATEILADGRLRVRRFYARRAKRLLPSVLVLLAVVVVAATTVWRDQLPTLRGGVLSSLGYVTNWWLIADKEPYFVTTGRPPMLQHLWSLAIEEQYYLVWTAAVVVLAGGVLAVRRNLEPLRRLRVVVWLAIALALVSTLLMAWQAESLNVPYGNADDTSRVYVGSDTHTMGLFLGSAFGALLALQHAKRGTLASRRLLSGWSRLSIAVTDTVGLVALAVACYQFVHVDEYMPRLYRGGFLAFDAVVLVAVLCATRPGSLFGRVLDVRPVRWIGQRSYAIYIWHWPVCVVTRPGQDVQGSTLFLNITRLVLILGLATLSYRFVEVPLRTGSWRRLVDRARPDRKAHDNHRPLWVFGSVVVTALAVLTLTLNRSAEGTPLGIRPTVAQQSSTPPRPSTSHAPTAASHSTSPHTQGAAHPSSTHSAGAGHATRPPSPPTLSISAFGDSVLLGAKGALGALLGTPPRLDVDAVEGRQAADVLNDIETRAAEHKLRPDVLIHIGDNGVISPSQLQDTLRALSDRARVVLMTVRVPQPWQDVNNATIRSVAKSFPNVHVNNWHGESDGRSDWLYDDGIHLRPAGATAYAQIVIHAFRATS